jgi:hypothetical protein
MDERFRLVCRAATCGRARQLLRGAMRASRKHFRHEERMLLPVVERSLGLGVLTALGEAFKKTSGAKKTRAYMAGLRV